MHLKRQDKKGGNFRGRSSDRDQYGGSRKKYCSHSRGNNLKKKDQINMGLIQFAQ